MPRFQTRYFRFCLMLLVAAGAAVAQNPKAENDLRGKYNVIEVTRFEVPSDVDIPANQINVLMLEIVDELYKIKKFDQIIKPPSNPTNTPVNSRPTVRLVGTIEKYSALVAQKHTIPMGDIWTRMKINVNFVDASDGKVLLQQEIDRRIFFGPYQFYFKDVSRKVAKEVAKITRKTFF